jgi:hypothetical protein
MIILTVIFAIIYIVLAIVFSSMIVYFFAQLVPSLEMIDIMIYEDFLLNQPKKNKR